MQEIRFFLSSSSQQLPIAKALEANLAAEGFEPTVWSREVHSGSQYNLEALFKEGMSSDFGIFIFAPDDTATIGGENYSIVRDNVLFELGLFIGILGRDRCFIVQSTEQPMRLPSDLEGFTSFKYDPLRSDGNLRRSLGPVTTNIAELARLISTSAESEFTNNDLKLLKSCKDTSMPSNQAFKAFGAMPESWDDKLCMRFVHLLEKGMIRRTGATEVETTRKGKLLSNATRRV